MVTGELCMVVSMRVFRTWKVTLAIEALVEVDPIVICGLRSCSFTLYKAVPFSASRMRISFFRKLSYHICRVRDGA